MSVEVLSAGCGSPNLQTKYAYPSKAAQAIEADDGYDGLARVLMSGDSNLVAENIKKGVSIFNVTGSAEVLWSQSLADTDGIKTQSSITMYGTLREMDVLYFVISEYSIVDGKKTYNWHFYSDSLEAGDIPGVQRTLHGTLYQTLNGLLVGSNWVGAKMSFGPTDAGDGFTIGIITTSLNTQIAFKAGDNDGHEIWIKGT